MKPVLYLLAAAVAFASCRRPPVYTAAELVDGYKPVFSNDLADMQISFKAPQAMIQPGKIYVKNNYIFQLDKFQGIHVFDKTTPANLRSVGFINVKGATEISISGNNLFTNVQNDLIVIDISDLQQPKIKGRVANAFQIGYYDPADLPVPLPEHDVFYECVNPAMGILVGWEKAKIHAQCYYP